MSGAGSQVFTRDELLIEYDQWREIADRYPDDWGAAAGLASLYRSAILAHGEPEGLLLLVAIADVQTAMRGAQ